MRFSCRLSAYVHINNSVSVTCARDLPELLRAAPCSIDVRLPEHRLTMYEPNIQHMRIAAALTSLMNVRRTP